ncbi:MAG TPA: hypothetical protein VGO07_04135, partial [Candidatus Saccharimonadales bacterium]|nr:hypothetical protein [Candidatus Saccharimonadales bacterium]
MPNRFCAYCIYGLGVLLLGILLVVPQHVFAAAYGRGAYSNCTYQGCRPQLTETRANLPSGLEVSINVVNGQAIPRDGYTIIVTPLNGQGTSFSKVDFYIDGKLIRGGVLPDETGTARWEWKPAHYPGTIVKIVVTDADGNTATQQFTVHIVTKALAAATLGSQQPHGISAILSEASDDAGRFIQALPPPVAYSFP